MNVECNVIPNPEPQTLTKPLMRTRQVQNSQEQSDQKDSLWQHGVPTKLVLGPDQEIQ